MNNIQFLKQTISDQENSDKFLLKNKQIELGYAYIYHGDFNNNIKFFIHPQYRSNGFGSLLFINIIKELKNGTNYSHIKLDIEKTNTHANNIISKHGGLILAEDSLIHWIVKL